MVISFYSTHMCAWALNQTPSRGPGVSEQCKISAAYLVPKSPYTANFRLPPPSPPTPQPSYHSTGELRGHRKPPS